MGARVPRRDKTSPHPVVAAEPRPDDSPNALAPRELMLAAAIYFIATLVLTHPLGLNPMSLSRLDNGDARLNAWAISWVAHQVVREPLKLFDANTFHPLPSPLAYSEHLFVEGLMALPLLWLTDDLVLTNNLILLFSIFASAFGMYLLTASLTRSRLAALLAGLFFSFAPFRFNRLPHIQMQLYAFLPLALACLHRFVTHRRWPWIPAAAGFFVLQVLSGTYLAAISAVALAIAVVFLTPFTRMDKQEWLAAGGSLIAILLVLLPFVRPYLWVNRTLGIEWDLPGVGSLSARPGTYLASSSHLYRQVTEAITTSQDRIDYLFPGLTLLILGGFGLYRLLAESGRRRIGLCYAAILVAGLVLSLGPNTPVYRFLYDQVVFFRGLRALTRFGLLPILSLSVTAAFALAWLLEGRGRLRQRRWIAVFIAVFFVAESTAIPYGLVPFEDRPPEVYRWLAEAEPGPIVELPYKVIDTRYMFWARHHGFRPMLNGDSGFIPASHQWIKIALQRFPSEDSVALLRRLEVRYVVVHLGAYRERALLRLLTGIDSYRDALLPVRDFGRDLVFELLPDPAASAGPHPVVGPGQGLEALPVTSDSKAAVALFDGDLETVWQARAREVELPIQLPEPFRVSAVRLFYGNAPRVPVERVEVCTEEADGSCRPFFASDGWPPVTELVASLLETPRQGSQTLHLPPITAPRFRLRLRGLDRAPQLTELTFYGDRQAEPGGDRPADPTQAGSPDSP